MCTHMKFDRSRTRMKKEPNKLWLKARGTSESEFIQPIEFSYEAQSKQTHTFMSLSSKRNCECTCAIAAHSICISNREVDARAFTYTNQPFCHSMCSISALSLFLRHPFSLSSSPFLSNSGSPVHSRNNMFSFGNNFVS